MKGKVAVAEEIKGKHPFSKLSVDLCTIISKAALPTLVVRTSPLGLQRGSILPESRYISGQAWKKSFAGFLSLYISPHGGIQIRCMRGIYMNVTH